MNLTPHHALYYAHDLTRRSGGNLDRLSMARFDAVVDLNPHQIEAALFALRLPLSQGVLLYWAERKRRLLVICPASIRKQWAPELEEKFNLHRHAITRPFTPSDYEHGLYEAVSACIQRPDNDRELSLWMAAAA